MHGHHGTGPRRNAPRYIGNIDIERVALDIGQDGRCTAIEDRVGRGYPGKCWYDNLVSRPYSERGESEMQASRC